VTTEADFWACSQCRSINKMRADRCYSCHTPREAAAVKPTEMPLSSKTAPLVVTETFRSSEGRAVLATFAMVLFILGTAVAVWMYWSIVNLRGQHTTVRSHRRLKPSRADMRVGPINFEPLQAFKEWRLTLDENEYGISYDLRWSDTKRAILQPIRFLGVDGQRDAGALGDHRELAQFAR